MKTFCLVVGLIWGANGASIDVLEVDTATHAAVTGVYEEAFTWKYESQTAGGHDPDDWGSYTAAETCGTGTSQSPIDVVVADVETATEDVGAVVGSLFDREMNGYLSNTGRGVRFSHLGMARPTISGGPLGDKIYAFSHIDFHFGEDDNEGSEHTINGDQYAMEMQMVFYDGSFMSNMDAEASSDSDALVAISHLFKVSDSDNANFDVIVDTLADIPYSDYFGIRKKRSADEPEKARQSAPYEWVELGIDNDNVQSTTLSLASLLGGATQIDNYYYYDGSMTVPNCIENTKWIISQTMLEISTAQLDEFRLLTTYDDPATSSNSDWLRGNFRPTQDLNSRTVYRRTAPFAVDETQLKILGGTLAGIPTFFLVNQFLNQPETAKALRENPVAEFVQSNLNNLFGGQDVVQQRSSDEAAQYQQYQQQPVYQPVQYQQYVPQAAPAAQ